MSSHGDQPAASLPHIPSAGESIPARIKGSGCINVASMYKTDKKILPGEPCQAAIQSLSAIQQSDQLTAGQDILKSICLSVDCDSSTGTAPQTGNYETFVSVIFFRPAICSTAQFQTTPYRKNGPLQSNRSNRQESARVARGSPSSLLFSQSRTKNSISPAGCYQQFTEPHQGRYPSTQSLAIGHNTVLKFSGSTCPRIMKWLSESQPH